MERRGGLKREGEPQWRPARRFHHADCSEVMWRWLCDSGSLTKRLRRAGTGDFRVRVQRQRYERPQTREAALLGLRRAERALVREVFLDTGGVPRVFARTVIPLRTLQRTGYLSRLGSRPLGAKLFADRSLKREKLQIARIDQEAMMSVAATYTGERRSGTIWARRSLFVLRRRRLLVQEVFLPQISACRPPHRMWGATSR